MAFPIYDFSAAEILADRAPYVTTHAQADRFLAAFEGALGERFVGGSHRGRDRIIGAPPLSLARVRVHVAHEGSSLRALAAAREAAWGIVTGPMWALLP